MSDPWTRRARRIRALVAVGVTCELLVGLATIVLFPAAFTAVVTGVAGARLVRTEPDDAALRLGVAVVAAGLTAPFAVFSGLAVLGFAAVVGVAALGAALHGVRVLRDDRHRTWAVGHQDSWLRLQESHARRDAAGSGRARGTQAEEVPSTAPDDDEAPWWEDLE